jgi:hypothetical protein
MASAQRRSIGLVVEAADLSPVNLAISHRPLGSRSGDEQHYGLVILEQLLSTLHIGKRLQLLHDGDRLLAVSDGQQLLWQPRQAPVSYIARACFADQTRRRTFTFIGLGLGGLREAINVAEAVVAPAGTEASWRDVIIERADSARGKAVWAWHLGEQEGHLLPI